MWTLLAFIGCAASRFPELEAVPTDAVSTVLDVRWRDDEGGGTAWVEHGPAGEDRSRRSVEVETEPGWRRVLVLGYPSLTDVELQPVVERDGERSEGPVISAQTGVLPAGLPSFELLSWDESAAEPGYVLGAGLGDGTSTLFIIDRSGEIVWYKVYSDKLVTVDVEEDLRGGLIAGLAQLDNIAFGAVDRVGWDGEDITRSELSNAHHAIEQPELGVIACIQGDIREVEGQSVIGDRLIELHEDGSMVEIFNAWDSLTYARHDRMGGRIEGLDWTHANGLSWDEARGVYLLSFRNLDLVLEIDRESREILRSFGAGGDWHVEPGEESFLYPHSPSWAADDRLLLFDSQPYSGDFYSRVREYDVFDEDMTLTVAWSWDPGDGRQVPALGEVKRLPNGHTLTDWGTSGEIIELDEDSEVVWRLVARAGFILGNVSPIELWTPLSGA